MRNPLPGIAPADVGLVLRRHGAASWLGGAALTGALLGWAATSATVPPAPAIAPADDPAHLAGPLAPAPAIVVEVLAPPDSPAASQHRAGPAHRPAEMAHLFFGNGIADNPAVTTPRLAGTPHDGAEEPLKLLPAAAPPDRAQRPGPPHRPGELYLLLADVGSTQGADGAPHAGPPHTMAERALILNRLLALQADTSTVLLTRPAGRDPGRFRHATPEPELAALPRPGPPHTMPEVVLLYGAMASSSDRARIDVIGSWQFPGIVAPALPEADPFDGDSTIAVAITETGPEPEPPGTDVPGIVPGTAPVIAIMIDDLGLNASRTARVVALQGPLTLAFIPYAEGLDAQVRLAARSGHEIFLHLPMEPIDPDEDPGPHALLVRQDSAELARQLAWNLDRFGGYVGVNNHMGSLLTQDAEAMALVMAELERRGLVFVDSVTSAASVAYEIAREHGVPSAERDIFLDNVPEVEAVLAQLSQLEDVARAQGYAIGIGHPHDATIAALARWLPQAMARGVVIAPASQLIESRDLIVAQHDGGQGD